jgi:predicted DNA-binding transcriptional regulator AlpA
MTALTPSNMINIKDVAALAGVHRESIRLWRRDDPNAPAEYRVGRCVYFVRTDIEHWLANRLPG